MAINYGDFCIVMRSSFFSYPTIIKFESHIRGQNCSCREGHMNVLNSYPLYREIFNLKEICLTDPLFIEIMETHIFRKDIKKEFGAWLKTKLVVECGEEILKSKITDKPKHSDAFIQVIESDEQLGFIHIND